MKKGFASLLMLFLSQLSFSQSNWTGNTSPTYPALIEHLQKLDKTHKELSLYNMGPSDYGLPIYLFVINGEKDSTRTFSKAQTGTTILINNAIHPGEPDGINACLRVRIMMCSTVGTKPMWHKKAPLRGLLHFR